ncbi:alanine racemase [Latilactobacillus graminis]|uniref:Alanine racemase n=2 Tax=Latilactobacillus graminis TaxID=60519 RepID=A0AA89I7D2_9LACO|nr:alanine racemase [Latilactobacillus graminis]KRM24477.1 alanine racemase [Latilactobacillus graminis DSM 20719]QFP79065.1 alanine racemase [Latilactobacillus graminis]
MTVGYLRPTRILVDQNAIYENIQNELKELEGTETVIFPVLKANAYGHGLLPVAQAAQAAGAAGFCVAILDEALALRRANFTVPILVLGITQPSEIELVIANQISVTVGSLEWLQAAYQIVQRMAYPQPIHIHLSVDSGMGRIGFRDATELLAAYTFIKTHAKYFDLEGIFTHFATADDPDDTYFQEQRARFNAMLAVLPERPRFVHVSNSATSLWHAACNGNLIRMGISMYGLNPSGNTISKLPYPLKPALSLESELVFVKKVQAGSKIGYGASYEAVTDEWIGTIPIGYADGWSRRMQGSTVLVNGQRCEIVGRICMDQLMIRLPQQYPVGTKVVLVGRSGDEEITLQEVAEYADTIHYEIICGLSDRLPRIYTGLDQH